MSVNLQKKPTARVVLEWPATPRNAISLLPIFIPFAGCPTRCVFCAQHLQTGIAQSAPFDTVIHHAEELLQRQYAETGTAMEVAFFGGTFTALPPSDFHRCLSAVSRWHSAGLVARSRCSTRPDADPARLTTLAEAGFSTVELGIQSFDSTALGLSRRGYHEDTAHEACAAVRGAGLALGVQLLPGMPGVTPDIFRQDVARALNAGAHMLRFYPCLVVRGTELARLWQAGAYAPWSLAQTVDALAEGWLQAKAQHVPVIRMGLAPEPGLEEHIVAGPCHPALGALVQGEALCRTVEVLVQQSSAKLVQALYVPRHCQGYFWGDRGSLRPRWERLGVTNTNVLWQEGPRLEILFQRILFPRRHT